MQTHQPNINHIQKLPFSIIIYHMETNCFWATTEKINLWTVFRLRFYFLHSSIINDIMSVCFYRVLSLSETALHVKSNNKWKAVCFPQNAFFRFFFIFAVQANKFTFVYRNDCNVIFNNVIHFWPLQKLSWNMELKSALMGLDFSSTTKCRCHLFLTSFQMERAREREKCVKRNDDKFIEMKGFESNNVLFFCWINISWLRKCFAFFFFVQRNDVNSLNEYLIKTVKMPYFVKYDELLIDKIQQQQKNHFKQHDNWQKWKKSTNLQTRHRLQLCWQIQTNVYCFRQTRINATSFVGFCCFNQLIYSLAGDIRQRVHANWKFSTIPISSMEHDTNWFKIYILI